MTALASAIYEGRVTHRRHLPREHAFTYRMAQVYLDLGELEDVFRDRWFWSIERRNLAQWRRADYLGPDDLPLDEAVRRRVHARTGHRPRGPIRMLSHLRYGGYVFNPVTFYYCYGEDRTTLDTIVAEITNTPWGERHAYVLPVDRAARHGRAMAWHFDKAFHVSPFMAMERAYDWRFTAPADDLRVHMKVHRGDACEFDADLALDRRPLNAASLARVLWRYPLMTAQVMGAIHWQALRLWLKRTPVHDHPGLASLTDARHGSTPGDAP
ncbi:DUF1365 domain-containing protein [Luteibacter sp. PPL201]|uniref:DUF1365 domain-containing protein n=1 Tax=Luteibacter sahnii TaxID=3021977 RepID=A0ABT6BC39_9GAMM|nr:DUF1365 domain-containing protein [Luteibacter sp. PPL193]MDY1547550.1 DUF1365 domain-containing protein [Luteibacter sp. PPL193]